MRNKLVAAWLLIAACVGLLSGQTLPPAATSTSVPATAKPDRVLLVWSDDPARTQTVTWRTDVPCEGAVAQIVPAAAAPGPDFVDDASIMPASTKPVANASEGGTTVYYHQVKFTGLEPATRYVYRVGDKQSWSDWNLFTTADGKPAPFRFIYLGDEQYKAFSLVSRVARSAFTDCPDARFIVHAGDLADTADADWMWREWYEALGWVYRTVPSIVCPGNHDQRRGGDKGLSIYWRVQFPAPLNGPQGLDSLCYYLDYQGVRVIVLDGSMRLEDQAAWLDKVLADATGINWTIIVIHQPIFSSGEDRNSEENQRIFLPVVDRHHVDLFLQGHDHTYARTHKVRFREVVGDKEQGTIYCTSVASPKQYPWNPRYEYVMSRIGQDKQLYQIISVEPDKLKYQSFTASGEAYDSFELKKDSAGQTQLLEYDGAASRPSVSATRPSPVTKPAAVPVAK